MSSSVRSSVCQFLLVALARLIIRQGCLSLCPSVCLSSSFVRGRKHELYSHKFACVCLSLRLSVCLFLRPFVYLFVCLSFTLCFSSFIRGQKHELYSNTNVDQARLCLTVCLFIRPFVCLSVLSFVRPSVRPSVCVCVSSQAEEGRRVVPTC